MAVGWSGYCSIRGRKEVGGVPEEGAVNHEVDNKSRGFSRVLWDWSRSLFLAFLLFLGVRAVAVEAFKIPTSSMEHTLLVGDFLLVNKAVYGARIPGTDYT